MLNSHVEGQNRDFSSDLVDFSMEYRYFRGFKRATRKSLKGRRLPMAVLCSFELEKDPIFRICAIRMDLRVKCKWSRMDVNFNHSG
jgi:hypothetical protein